MPITLYYLAYGSVHTVKICLFWNFWNYNLHVISLILTEYASIERYFLVFHRHEVLKHKVLFHYIPILCLTIYIPVWYFYLIFFLPCQKARLLDITVFTCGMPCFFGYAWITAYDAIANLMLPSLIILIFNTLMIVRVVVSRTVALGAIPVRETLKKNRRMILQLLGISLMSLIMWLPWVVILIGKDFFDPSFGNWFVTYILYYVPYITASLSPFFGLIGLPEIRKKFKIRALQTAIIPI
ncbi:hypothetical protein I4U23_011107 [Adineta vaga]|nr:hypothetical protein I4U23_011107 [Adineta vaga]